MLKSITEIDWEALRSRPFTPSPEQWNDQVVYFLLIDRFSDGKETPETAYSGEHRDSAIQTEADAERWRAAGYTFCGGTLNGVRSKLDYLSNLGITTLWLSPVLQQPIYDPTTYHGYATQNFLAIDHRFGTQEDFQSLVAEAHQLGIYVVLDIVVNHAGHVFDYDVPVCSETEPRFHQTGTHPVVFFHDASGQSTIPFGPIDLEYYPEAWPYGAIWPKELQSADTFNRRGCISNWEHPDEYLHGDFKFLKDINMGVEKEEVFYPSEALLTLIKVYQYWMAYADLDGFRLDAVKHMGIQATQYFVTEIQNFAKELGKQNFAIFGEIPGGEQQAHTTLHQTGLTAALALLDIPQNLELMMKGATDAVNYFQYFHSTQSEQAKEQQITWKKNEIVLFLDDHDQIRKNFDKARFAFGPESASRRLLPALATLVCSAGIPCLYYGSELAFDGQGSHDRYIRETMFASEFGAFRSRGCHFFDQQHQIYVALQRLLAVRKQSLALCRGEQQLLEISGDGEHYGYPSLIGKEMKSVLAWMRWTDHEWMFCLVSNDPVDTQSVWIELPNLFPRDVQEITCVFSSTASQLHQTIQIERELETSQVQVTLNPTQVILYQALLPQ